MRPRPGDFLYSSEEIELMSMQIVALKAVGATGFVIGCLTPEGDLDKDAMLPLIKAADGAPLTLHRCIDVSRDLIQTWHDAKELGIDTVLTSGGAADCMKGLETIGKLLALRDSENGPEILIGAGVNADRIRTIRSRYPNAHAFHASCKLLVESGMVFRREDIPMGLPGLDEWHIQQTGEENVRQAKLALTE
jgi:copper homeostasis protein